MALAVGGRKGTALTMPMGEYRVEKLPALPVADPIKPAR